MRDAQEEESSNISNMVLDSSILCYGEVKSVLSPLKSGQAYGCFDL